MPESKKIALMHSSKSNEWYTPKVHLELAREVLGSIALDPAANAEANRNVKAERFFTAEDDGLSLPWNGETVFCNPPYGRSGRQSNQALWSSKFLREYEQKNFVAGILLTNSCFGDDWFNVLPETCWTCFPFRRIKFIGQGESPTKGNCFSYLGPNPERFSEIFCDIGHVFAPNGRNSQAG